MRCIFLASTQNWLRTVTLEDSEATKWEEVRVPESLDGGEPSPAE